MPQVHIDLRALKAAARIAPRYDIRYYLNSVMVEAAPDHTLYVATNGHCLIVLRTDGENEVDETKKFIIPIAAVESSIRGPRKALTQARRMGFDEDHVYLPMAVSGAELKVRTIEAKYPCWRRVVPRKVSGEAATFQTRLLRLFQDAQKDIGATGSVEIGQNGLAGGLVRCPGAGNILMAGVVMPFRSEAPTVAPDWLGLEMEPAEQETETA